jgi:sulfite exporter TauE/SafE
MSCNPGIYILLSVTVLKEFNLWIIAMLIAYAISFSLPLAAIMLVVSFGRSVVRAKVTEAAIRIVAGIILVAAGFYLLATNMIVGKTVIEVARLSLITYIDQELLFLPYRTPNTRAADLKIRITNIMQMSK